MATNFLLGTNFWSNLDLKKKEIFKGAFEILKEDYFPRRGDIAELMRKSGAAHPTAKKYLTLISLVGNAQRTSFGLNFLERARAGGNTTAIEAFRIYTEISSEQNEAERGSATNAEKSSAEEPPTHPAIASLDDARRHFLDVVGRNVTLEKENASLRAECAKLQEEMSRLRELEKALRTRLQAREELLASLRSTLSKDTNGGVVHAVTPIAPAKKAKKGEERSMVLAYDLPTSTPAIPPWAKREMPIQYSADFLKALDALNPGTRGSVISRIQELVTRGRKETQTSQQHKIYNGHMVSMPEKTTISRGTREIRFLWGYQNDGNERKLIFRRLGKHTEFWKSEK